MEMFEDFMEWFKTDPEAQEYAHLDWTEDREELMKWHEEHPEGKTEVTL